MIMMRPLRRGVSTLILAFLVATVILSIFTYLVLSMARATQTTITGLRSVAEYSYKANPYSLMLNETMGAKALRNLGGSDLIIDKVVVRNRAEGSLQILTPAEAGCPSNVVKAGSELQCIPPYYDYDFVAVINTEGVVINIYRPMIRARVMNTTSVLLIPITFDVKSPTDLVEQFAVPPNLVAKPYTNNPSILGMRSGGQLLLLPPGQESELYNESIYTESGRPLPFGVAIVGYDPSWVLENRSGIRTPTRFSLLLAGSKSQGIGFRAGNRRISLAENGWRILINNFTGYIKIWRKNEVIACTSTNQQDCSGVSLPAVGFWYYGVDSGLNLRIEFNGVAGYVANFMRMASSQSPTRETSYYPFIYVGDVDGNGVSDIVLVTEDVYYGSSDKIDDLWPGETGTPNDYSDYSTQPLVLRLLQIGEALGNKDGSIDGSEYSGVLLFINILFHDNSYPDVKQLEDIDRTDWVLRVVLLDDKGNEYIVREYRYQEICNYHKTYVTDFGRDNYFVKLSQTVYVPIPGAGRYWIAVVLQDPYKSGNTNDADLTVGVEFIGAIPFYR
jgi:hypothetical protein